MKLNENLMKDALNSKLAPKKRFSSFNELYKNHVKINGNDSNWDNERIMLRGKFAHELTNKEKEVYGLTERKMKESFTKLLKNKQKRNSYPTEFFYQISYPIISKLLRKGDSVLEVGYGEFPALQKILKKDNLSYLGLEPFPKKVDNKNLFKGSLYKLPSKINKEYNLVLANMVYTINYTNHCSKNFKWELKNKIYLLKIINKLVKKMGYFVLIDDIGTIFSKRELKEYFKILIFEKDIEIKDFNNKGKIIEFGKVTILQKI